MPQLPFRKKAAGKDAGVARLAKLKKKFPGAWAEGERWAQDAVRDLSADHGAIFRRVSEKEVESYVKRRTQSALYAFKEAVEAGRIDIGERLTQDSLVAFGASMGLSFKNLLMREHE